MTELVKDYADWLLKKYSSHISVPKEIYELNKAQKVWLILTCPFTLIAWLFAFLILFLTAAGDFDPGEGVLISTLYFLGGFFLPIIAYWVIEAIHKLIVWVRD
jgi:hypothetical protein